MPLTQEEVRDAVQEFVREYKERFDADCNRNDVIDQMSESCDELWGKLVKEGRLDQYRLDDLVETVADCATVITVAEEDAWVEEDSGLWEGITYGVVPCIAYHSLNNLMYNALKRAGIDTNDEEPFKVYKEALQKAKDYAERLVAAGDMAAFKEVFGSDDKDFDISTMDWDDLQYVVEEYCEEE
jgi:hypothetical protein